MGRSSVEIGIRYTLPEETSSPNDFRGEASTGRAVTDADQRHHLVPRHLMYYLGVIIMIYMKEEGTAKGSARSSNSGTLSTSPVSAIPGDAFQKTLGSIHYEDSTRTYHFGADAPFMKYFSWLPCNLFLGPRRSLRGDDPGQGYDKAPMGSIGLNQWGTAIQDLLRTYHSSAPPTTKGQDPMHKSIKIKKRTLSDLAQGVLKVVEAHKPESKKIYDTTVADWVVKIPSVAGICFPSNPPVGITGGIIPTSPSSLLYLNTCRNAVPRKIAGLYKPGKSDNRCTIMKENCTDLSCYKNQRDTSIMCYIK